MLLHIISLLITNCEMQPVHAVDRQRARVVGLRTRRKAPKAAYNSLISFQDLKYFQYGQAGGAACTRASASVAAAATDEHFMRLALQQAQMAFEAGEVPIGAVLVVDTQVEAAAYNMTEASHNPLCHAELLCISAAANKQLAWRLQDATLYSTVEPCPMCAGAILQARLARLVYGARQPRVGADGSWVAMFPRQQQQQKEQGDTDQCSGQLYQGQEQQQHQQAALQPTGPHPFHPDIEVTSGVLAEECAELMKAFFRRRRREVKAKKAAATAAAAGVMAAAPADGTLTVQCSCGGPTQPFQGWVGLTTADQRPDITTEQLKDTHSPGGRWPTHEQH